MTTIKFFIGSLISMIIISFAQIPLQAQNRASHELSIYSDGGLSTFFYKPAIGTQKLGIGGEGGLMYTLLFTKNIGLNIGAGVTFYQSTFFLDELKDSYFAIDYQGNDFEFRTVLSNYEEKQKGLFVHIPLSLYFQTDGKQKFYASIGAKIAIPVSGKYVSSESQLQTSGYYIFENMEYDTQEFIGFGNFIQSGKSEKLTLNFSVMLSAEVGGKWALGDKTSLYTGIYFDYGLNNIRKGDYEPMVRYAAADEQIVTLNPSWNVNCLSENQQRQAIVEKVNTMAVGLKIAFGFKLGK